MAAAVFPEQQIDLLFAAKSFLFIKCVSDSCALLVCALNESGLI